ncbi:hypothetical protein Ga0061061_10923 [Chelatococcus sambhunathii]|uniref:Uncharacterized protein n=2 Tax=Chelatococcus sambhunathii TaxID=363953 RepID=A0ABM9U7H6_9HYPH|nr:hypothetical protein Ga0061061_10923 [Chelatococcus sambhunathii]
MEACSNRFNSAVCRSFSPYLRMLGGYSAATVGLLMAPRGVGTMIAMLVAGRLSSPDPRLIDAHGYHDARLFALERELLDTGASVATLTMTTVLLLSVLQLLIMRRPDLPTARANRAMP